MMPSSLPSLLPFLLLFLPLSIPSSLPSSSHFFPSSLPSFLPLSLHSSVPPSSLSFFCCLHLYFCITLTHKIFLSPTLSLALYYLRVCASQMRVYNCRINSTVHHSPSVCFTSAVEVITDYKEVRKLDIRKEKNRERKKNDCQKKYEKKIVESDCSISNFDHINKLPL